MAVVLRLLLVALVVFAASMANAAETVPGLRGSITCLHARTQLFEIWVNGHRSNAVVRAMMQGSKVLVRRADLNGAGLVEPPLSGNSGLVDIARVPGVQMRIDTRNQRLLLLAKPTRLRRRVYDLSPAAQAISETPAAHGATLGYALSASDNDLVHTGENTSGGVSADLTLFGPGGRFKTNAFARFGHGKPQYTRLDTAFIFDNPAIPSRIIVGDSISGATSWSRPVRFGGMQIASDYALAPNRITTPLPDFFGTAQVPQTLDVYIGQARVFEQDVPEGPFALRNLPILTGGGSATISVRDVLGRQGTQTISLYTNDDLLAPGLSRFAFDAGVLRRDYGVKNFSYARPLVTATVAHGISNTLTLNAHGEAARGLALAGGGAAFGLGGFGVMSADVAASHSKKGTGLLGSLGFQARAGAISAYGGISATRGPYRDLASFDGPDPARLRYQLGLTASLALAGNLGVSWVGLKRKSEAASNLLSASYSKAFGDALYLGLTGLRDFAARHWAVQMFVSMPLGAQTTASVSASSQAGKWAGYAAIDRPANPDGGFGYRMMKGFGNSETMQGDVTWAGTRALGHLALASNNGRTALRGDLDGAIVFMHGRIFATRKREGAMALVETGAADVRIYRENRKIARSDDDGEALLTGLVPYTRNRIAVESRDYPMSVIIARNETLVVPPREAGVIVNLAPKAPHPARVLVRMADGTAPPLGARVTRKNSAVPLIVGRNGEVFFSDLPEQTRIQIKLTHGFCAAHISRPRARIQPRGIPKLGPFVCEVHDVD